MICDFLNTARNEVGARLYFHRRLWFCRRGDAIPACIAGGIPAYLAAGVPGLGGAWSGGCAAGGVCSGGAWWRPPMATAADGTHPTGMHYCFKFKIRLIRLGLSFQRTKIPAFELTTYWFSVRSHNHYIEEATVRQSKAFSNHAWLILVEFT